MIPGKKKKVVHQEERPFFRCGGFQFPGKNVKNELQVYSEIMLRRLILYTLYLVV